MMRIAQTRLSIDTTPREIKEITAEVARWAERQHVSVGLLTLYIQHTSASLLIQENASPDVLRDLDVFLRRVVPEDVALYRHNDEGPDDMPAHIKSALTQTQLTIPVADGRLQLGTWQGIFVLEHRASPHRRSLILTLIGEEAAGSFSRGSVRIALASGSDRENLNVTPASSIRDDITTDDQPRSVGAEPGAPEFGNCESCCSASEGFRKTIRCCLTTFATGPVAGPGK
jgi:secondary thiamine-phosphate synthase enzyme